MAIALPVSATATITTITTPQLNGKRNRDQTIGASRGMANAASGTMQTVKSIEIVNGSISWRHGVRHVAPLKIATAVMAAAMLQPSMRIQ